MCQNRVLKFFLVPILIILGSVLSERADADFDNAVFPLLQGIEKMVVHSPSLKDPGKDIPFESVSGDIITQNSFNGSSWFRISMKDLMRDIEGLSLRPDEGGVLMITSPHITHVDCFVPKTLSTYEHYSYDKDSRNVLQFLYTRYPVLWLSSLNGAAKGGYAYLNVRSDYPVAARLCAVDRKSVV